MLLTLNLASIALAFWLITQQTRISPIAKSYLWSVLFTGGVNTASIAQEPYGREMIVPGFSQTLRRYQGNLQ